MNGWLIALLVLSLIGLVSLTVDWATQKETEEHQ